MAGSDKRGYTRRAARRSTASDRCAQTRTARSGNSNAWRVYQVLCYRFEEQSSQDDVAAQMAVSARQVRRLEQTAIHALASQIAAHYGLSFAGHLNEKDRVSPESVQPVEEIRPAHEQELDWLRISYAPENADIYQLVESALKTAQPMLTAAGGSASIQLPADLPQVNGQTTTLRQILLNLLLAAMGAAPDPLVTIKGSLADRNIELFFSTARGESPYARSVDSGEFLNLARRLAELSGGEVEQLPAPVGAAFLARLSLPAVDRVTVLFVDDNGDSLRLFERSLEGTRFRFAGTRDPLRAIELAIESSARIIILDIMLPDIDGWEMLGRLRTHPRLGGIPVIISTILPHEQLAFSLGAAGFLRKPVSREALLELLNRLHR